MFVLPIAISFFKLFLFLNTGFKLVLEKIAKNLLFLRNFCFSANNKLLISFWNGSKHPGRMKFSCSSLSSWIWSCDQTEKQKQDKCFDVFLIVNKNNNTPLLTQHFYFDGNQCQLHLNRNYYQYRCLKRFPSD